MSAYCGLAAGSDEYPWRLQVIAVVGLQPFLWPNAESSEQRRIAGMVGIGPLCVLVAALGSLVSLLPARIMDWVRTNIFLGAWNQSLHAAGETAAALLPCLLFSVV